MSRRRTFTLAALLAVLGVLGLVLAEDAQPHAVLPAAEACARCHAEDAAARAAAHAPRPCTPFCMTCHPKADMDRHHAVGSVLSRMPGPELPLASGNRVACATCHLMSRLRYDEVRWKAASLYDRMFRHEPRYKTYFLSIRNDQGQLCLSCH